MRADETLASTGLDREKYLLLVVFSTPPLAGFRWLSWDGQWLAGWQQQFIGAAHPCPLHPGNPTLLLLV